MIKALLPSLTNLPVFFVVLVTLVLMLILSVVGVYRSLRGLHRSGSGLAWLKLLVALPLLLLGAAWTYFSASWLATAGLVAGSWIWVTAAAIPVAVYVFSAWWLVRWIRNSRYADAGVIIVIAGFAGAVVAVQRVWLCEPLAHSGLGYGQLCTAGLYEAGSGGVIRDRQTARRWYRRAAERGIARAEFWVAMDTRDPAVRLQWLTRAAEQGYPPAAYWLFLNLPADREHAIEWLQLAARKNHGPALYRLGLLHSNGYRIPQDIGKTRALWQRAARSRDPTSMRALALAYARGVLYEIDLEASARWQQRAIAATGEDRDRLPPEERHFAQTWQTELERLRSRARLVAAGDPDALRSLSRDILSAAGDDAELRARGMGVLERVAAKGDAEAQYQVASYYFNERNGPDAIQTGVEWLIRAADSGHYQALRRVIDAFKKGEHGLPIDLHAARRYGEHYLATLEHDGVARNDPAWLAPSWEYQDTLAQIERLESQPLPRDELERRAAAGDAFAQYHLARDLEFYDRDVERAQHLRAAAAHGGYPQAQFEAARRIMTRQRTPAEEQQAIAWLVATADSGHRGALVELGHLYARGLPRQRIERDYYKAKVYYQRAIDGVEHIVYQQQTAPDRAWHITVESVGHRLAALPDFVRRLDLEGLSGEQRVRAIAAWYQDEHARLIKDQKTADAQQRKTVETTLTELTRQRELLLN